MQEIEAVRKHAATIRDGVETLIAERDHAQAIVTEMEATLKDVRARLLQLMPAYRPNDVIASIDLCLAKTDLPKRAL
jgi:hypothetical protein